MNPEQIREGRKLLEAATPGPWTTTDELLIEAPSRRVAVIAWKQSEPNKRGETHPLDFGIEADASLIVLLVNHAEELFNAVEALGKLVQADDEFGAHSAVCQDAPCEDCAAHAVAYAAWLDIARALLDSTPGEEQ